MVPLPLSREEVIVVYVDNYTAVVFVFRSYKILATFHDGMRIRIGVYATVQPYPICYAGREVAVISTAHTICNKVAYTQFWIAARQIDVS